MVVNRTKRPYVPGHDEAIRGTQRAEEIGRDAAFAEMAKLATPLGRYAKAEEVAGQIAFLLGEESALTTGTVLLSDGGYTL